MNAIFSYPYTFLLETGEQLVNLEIAYTIFGEETAKETIWVCHALSGNADVLSWWPGLFGADKPFDPAKYRIICANVIGSCYGSTGPSTSNEPAYFPIITIRDMVNAHILLRKHLNIQEIDILIGASLGGQQAVEWAIEESDSIKKLILIATNARHSSFGKGFNEAQRLAIFADETYGRKNGGKKGLAAARAIAMLSYRSYADFAIKQSDAAGEIHSFRAASYLQYQGKKFSDRFDAHSYVTLTRAMDSHNCCRNRTSMEQVLGGIKAKTLVVGINSDLLFPLEEQKEIARCIPKAEFGCINSVYGHDAFLIEYQQLNTLINDFLINGFKQYKPTTLKQKTNVT